MKRNVVKKTPANVYKKKKQYPGGYTGYSQSGRMLNVFSNPFSNSTLNAKIPDGSATLSCASRFQLTEQFVLKGGSSYLLLVPGLRTFLYIPFAVGMFPTPNSGMLDGSLVGNDGAAVTGTAPDVGTAAVEANAGETIGGTGYGGTNMLKGMAALVTKSHQATADSNNATTIAWQKNNIDKWRLVSMGMKLICTNNSEQNDGWFEAIRLSTGINDGNGDMDSIKRVFETFIVAASPAKMIDQPSYIQGRIRDIGKYVFQLKPDGLNFNFNKSMDMFDNGFDMILIKINGRTVPTGDNAVVGDAGTSLIAHIVSNQEIVYGATCPLSRFHTESVYDSRWQGLTHAKALDIKAGRKIINV